MKGYKNTPIPARQTEGSCGYDFYASEDIHVKSWRWTSFDSNIYFTDEDEVTFDGVKTKNWFMLLAPRSGMGSRYHFRFANTVGIIDKDYRGSIKFKVKADKSFTIKKGDRYAQGIFLPYGVFTDEIPPIQNRMGGHGSTGQ